MRKAVLLFLFLTLGLPINGYAKPKMTIQLVAVSIESSGLGETIFIILPDGSHATAECWLGIKSSCGIDAFRPEKRIKKSCHSAQERFATCYAGEAYYATRKGNDITIYAANGERVYHITGSWDSFEDDHTPSIASSRSDIQKTASLQGFDALNNKALNGDPDAQFKLGAAYYHGEGEPQDYEQAAIWYRKAAEQGNAEAQLKLGALLALGQGVPQDWAESYFWFDLAAFGKQGELRPEEVIEYRDGAASHLTKSVLLQTQERARKWFEAHPPKAQ